MSSLFLLWREYVESSGWRTQHDEGVMQGHQQTR